MKHALRTAGRTGALLLPLLAGNIAIAAADVSVTFANPDNFAEARDAGWGASRQSWMRALEQALRQRAAPRLADGQRLDVTITDVDLAGSFEPWRGPQLGSVRIVRDVYPPRIDLTFRLLAADGSVLREGERQLRDMAFLMRVSAARSDPLRFEKSLLDDWIEREFAAKRE